MKQPRTPGVTPTNAATLARLPRQCSTSAPPTGRSAPSIAGSRLAASRRAAVSAPSSRLPVLVPRGSDPKAGAAAARDRSRTKAATRSAPPTWPELVQGDHLGAELPRLPNSSRPRLRRGSTTARWRRPARDRQPAGDRPSHIPCTHSFRTNGGYTDARIDRLRTAGNQAYGSPHDIPLGQAERLGWPCALGSHGDDRPWRSRVACWMAPRHPPIARQFERICAGVGSRRSLPITNSR
jgi:hypothetical protein